MTLGEAIEIALNKADFKREDFSENTLYIYADIAQKKIALYCENLIKTMKINKEHNRIIDVPSDFYKKAPCFIRNPKTMENADYCFFMGDNGKRKIKILDEGEFEIYYIAFPQNITEETSLSYEFEVPKETHFAIPFYITYEIAKNDDTIIAQTALNEWNNIISAFERKKSGKSTIIRNYY